MYLCGLPCISGQTQRSISLLMTTVPSALGWFTRLDESAPYYSTAHVAAFRTAMQPTKIGMHLLCLPQLMDSLTG